MTPNDPTRPDAGEANVGRLLEQANDPAQPSPDFTRRLHARLLTVAAEEARRRAAPVPRTHVFGGRLATMTAAAALLGAIALGFQFWPAPPSATPPVYMTVRLPDPSAAPRRAEQGPARTLVRDRLTAAPRPAVPRLDVVGAGTMLRTRLGERRRVRLDDDSVLFLNQDTTATYDGGRHVTLTKGEVFVEVAPRKVADADALFTVDAPRRAVQALGTKFVVRAGDAGTGVAVTQGKVKVDRTIVTAGQQLAPGSDRPTPAPRASHLLAWTRDLVAAAAGILVPASRHAGGALVAVDPRGQEAQLSLRKYHVDVHVEDGFARTTIDQTYFNHMPYRLEGTFFFPLPPDASLSRLAMYVNGQLMEGGMVERDYGRVVFDQIVKKMQDPALLEWVDGSTFKMRVFPLEGRQEKRIVLSYTQRLPGLYGRLAYRFPAGHSLEAVRDWSFHARVKDGAGLAWQCSSHALKARPDGADLVLEAKASKVRVDRDVVLELGEGSHDAGPAVARFSSAEQDGARYLMLRYRPELTGAERRQRRDWVFLVETSGDRNPLLACTQVEIVRTLLANAEHDDTFTLLTAGARVRTWSPTPHPVTAQNVTSALAFLEGAHLVGALDLDRGLKAAADLLARSDNPHLVHVGSGLPALGEGRSEHLLTRLSARACYVGVGVGKRWARSFMKRAAERSKGYFTQINPDEPVAWRAFDLLATLNTPRLMDVRVVDPARKVTFLSDTSSVCQGEELCTMARLDGGPLPEAVTVTGVLDGKPFRRVQPVREVRPKADYLPRTWARLEIDRLLAADATKNKDAIVALSKAMYVMTPYTSLLVLENEAMYTQFKVDRGRKDHWAMYPCPAKILVVYEPEPLGSYYYLGITHATANDVTFTDGTSNNVVFTDGTSNTIQFGRPGDPNPLYDMAEASAVDRELNALGFYPPAMALVVKGTSTIHNRASNQVLNNKDLAAALKRRIDPADLYNVTIPPPPGTGGGRGGNPIMTDPGLVGMADGSVRQVHQALHYFRMQDATAGGDFKNLPATGTPRGMGRYYNPGGRTWASLPPRTRRLLIVLAKLADLISHGHDARADRLLTQSLADTELAREPVLWRMGVLLAMRMKRTDVALVRLERAVELEYEHLPAVYDVEAIRHDYGLLLAHYEKQASARPAKDLAAKTLRIADRWRALDPDAKSPCEAAARVLRLLGKSELAWEYQTTALAAPAAASGWLAAAKHQAEAKAYDHADQAFAAAFALEPGNARVLWDRAMNLLQAHRPAQARALLRELAEGTWGPEHKDVQGWARALMQR